MEHLAGVVDWYIRTAKATGQRLRPNVGLQAMNLLYIFGRITLSMSILCMGLKPSSADIPSCNDATEIFFLGVGCAYDSIIHLLINRGQFSFQAYSFLRANSQLMFFR